MKKRLFGPRSEKICLRGFANNKSAYPQSDQRLCYSLIEKYHIYTCLEQNFNFLANPCSRGDWFAPHFVGNPEDRFSRDAAHLIIMLLGINLVFLLNFVFINAEMLKD